MSVTIKQGLILYSTVDVLGFVGTNSTWQMLCVLTHFRKTVDPSAGLQLAVNLKCTKFAQSLAKGQTDSDVEHL